MKPIGRISKSQCQAKELTGSFMTFGPRREVRCKNKPDWIAVERKPRKEDGKIGQMSLCDLCKGKLIEQLGKNYATFKLIEPVSCCVVGDDCECPANLENTLLEEINLRTKCFACGLYVCKECSRIMKWYNYGRRRICNNCEDEFKRKG